MCIRDRFVDPIHESMDALSVAYALLKSHEVIDLLIIMLGTNDVKERFGANAACIAAGMELSLIHIWPNTRLNAKMNTKISSVWRRAACQMGRSLPSSSLCSSWQSTSSARCV